MRCWVKGPDLDAWLTSRPSGRSHGAGLLETPWTPQCQTGTQEGVWGCWGLRVVPQKSLLSLSAEVLQQSDLGFLRFRNREGLGSLRVEELVKSLLHHKEMGDKMADPRLLLKPLLLGGDEV